jgi:hypothetical protein
MTFAGTSQYINCGNVAALQPGVGSWELWVKTTGAPADKGLMDKVGAIGLWIEGGTLSAYSYGGTSGYRSTGFNVNDGVWHHVVLTFQSGVTNGSIVYLDGTARLTTTLTVLNQTNQLRVGHDTYALTSTVDEVAVYSTVLSAARVLAHYNKGGVRPSLLLHADDAGATITDSSGSPKAITAFGTATQSAAQSKFGGSSLYFDGTANGYLGAAASADLDLSSAGDFTVDCWLRPSAKADYMRVMGYGSGSGNWTNTAGHEWIIFLDPTNHLGVQFNINNTYSTFAMTTATVADNVWTHIAWVRSGTTHYLFVNGVLDLTATSQPAMITTSGTNRLRIGTIPSEEAIATYAWIGYMDEIRITKGAVLWSATFSVPTAPSAVG